MTTTTITTYPGPVSKLALWTGRIISTLLVLMLIMSAGFKILQRPEAIQGFAKGGYPPGALVPLGVVELGCTILYVIPQTSVLGAILLTGYLGGAIDVHVRAGEPFIFPAIMGVLVWLALFLRDRRIRALIPIKFRSR